MSAAWSVLVRCSSTPVSAGCRICADTTGEKMLGLASGSGCAAAGDVLFSSSAADPHDAMPALFLAEFVRGTEPEERPERGGESGLGTPLESGTSTRRGGADRGPGCRGGRLTGWVVVVLDDSDATGCVVPGCWAVFSPAVVDLRFICRL